MRSETLLLEPFASVENLFIASSEWPTPRPLRWVRQNWPFENEIAGVTSGEEINDCDNDDDNDVDDVVFIVEGRQRCYGSARAWEVID